MDISPTVALLIIALVLLGLYILNGCSFKRQKDNFTRTPMTADTNCRFVRQHVDYAYGPDGSDIPEKQGKEFPHFMADVTDKLQPLEDGHVNLIRDEDKLWGEGNPRLWDQYTHNFVGCGNGKPYIVNDDKTRFALYEGGDIWATRVLEAEHLPAHGPRTSIPALTDLDMSQPAPFEQEYGGAKFLKRGDVVGLSH